MSPDHTQEPGLHALLVGIDLYRPGQAPPGTPYPSLAGCVWDVTRMEDFLRRRLGVPAERIEKLTATDTGAAEPPEPPGRRPTYTNLVGAFRRLTATAAPGDEVVIHYSGHGGRVPTLVPEVKGETGLDETLVPWSISDPDERHLRDVELATLVAAMVDKGLRPTLILDACHSGGAVRGAPEVAVRGAACPDRTPRPRESHVAPRRLLSQTWRRLWSESRRELASTAGWLPQPRGFLLLAACRATERAFESLFDGRRAGVFTHALLGALEHLGPHLTYQRLHHRVVAAVHSRFACQTPQLEGEGDRLVFGTGVVPSTEAAHVLRVGPASGRLLLDAGQLQGVVRGARFAVYPAGTAEPLGEVTWTALVEVVEAGASCSEGEVIQCPGRGELQPGAPAVLVSAAPPGQRRTVRLVYPRRGAARGAERRALAAVEERITRRGEGFLELAREGADPDFQVTVGSSGTYGVLERSGRGMALGEGVLPVAGAPRAAARLVELLEHLARYSNVRELENLDPLCPLRGLVRVELGRLPPAYDPDEVPVPTPWPDGASAPAGSWVCLSLRSEAPGPLAVAVLDLASDWSIRQVFPLPGAGRAALLEPGECHLLPLRASLPAGRMRGTDLLKVFASIEETGFRWLELPALAGPGAPRRRLPPPETPLEAYFAAFSSRRGPLRRELTPARFPSRQWAVVDLEIPIVSAVK